MRGHPSRKGGGSAKRISVREHAASMDSKPSAAGRFWREVRTSTTIPTKVFTLSSSPILRIDRCSFTTAETECNPDGCVPETVVLEEDTPTLVFVDDRAEIPQVAA
jgi:hypothetical protein